MIYHLHRVVHLPVKTIDDIAREHGIDGGEYLRAKIRQQDREYDDDLRLIGFGLAAGYLFVIIARLSALGVI